MVNSLLCVKPSVPSTTYLKRWSNKQESLKQKMTLIRYGTPKTLKGITIRMRLNSSGSSRGSNNGSNHKIDTDRNVGYVNLVPLNGAYGNRKKV